ncbi:MAG: ATP-binding protein [Sphaerobacter sp.]|nr:ATP-binding protein [Sphaerobacter sp.]
MEMGAPGPTTHMLSTREPSVVEQTGLDLSFICDLTLKAIYYQSGITAQALSDLLCLPHFNVLERALAQLKREELIEVTGSQGFGELAYQYQTTPKGSVRAQELIERNSYVGPAPVTLHAFTEMVERQSIQATRVTPAQVRRATADLVFDEDVLDTIGQAVNTGRSLFLFGASGNGKTALAERVARMLGGHVLIPYAILVDGQIIKMLDLQHHEPIPAASGRTDYDRRWVLCRRPVVMAGGELTLASLDLVYDPVSKVYEAPLQMKAINGMFLIDDFGRQQVRPADLLNRWIVPLEKRVDFLTLHTGKKIEIPFDELIVFSTNLQPRDLVDEAFLRRIQNKVHVGNPSPNQFREIFRRQCDELGVPFDQEGLVYLLREYYVKPKRELRACHPRDILRTLVGIARYLDQPPSLSQDLIDRACRTYFVAL